MIQLAQDSSMPPQFAAINSPHETSRDFLVPPFANMAAETLLAHFRNRDTVRFFAPSKGDHSRVARADLIWRNAFSFNNETHRLPDPIDWHANPSSDIEWLISLHKFYYAKDLGAAYAFSKDERYAHKWVTLIESWIDQVPLGFIDAQVTGRRLQQWIQSFHNFVQGRHSSSVEADFLVKFLGSIHDQALYLTENLTEEGNHRTIELYGIFLVAVLFPELRNADRLLAFAKREILANLRQDLLPDGVHSELSTEYHHTVLENYLRVRRLATLNQIALPEGFDALLKQALQFSLHVHKPDGFIPAINDADWKSFLSVLKKGHECYPDPHLLYVISQGTEGLPPPSRSVGFPDSGYYILRSDWKDLAYKEALYFFFDCAAVGTGTHGHYDALNFELAAYGHSLIVDPGRYTYSESGNDGINWRKAFRATAHHNTIVVDGKDQTAYRLNNSAKPQAKAVMKEFTTASGFDFIHGLVTSDQYPVIHERSVFFLHPEYWIIADRLEAEGLHSYDLRFHLHPRALGCTDLHLGTETTTVFSPNLILAQPTSKAVSVNLEAGFVSPSYGVKEKSPVIRFSQAIHGSTVFNTVIYPCRSNRPALTVREVPVYRNAVRCDRDQVIALKITLDGEFGVFTDHFFVAHGDTAEFEFDDIRVTGKLFFLRRGADGVVESLQVNQIQSAYIGGNLLLDFDTRSSALSHTRASRIAGESVDEFLPDWLTQRTRRKARSL